MPSIEVVQTPDNEPHRDDHGFARDMEALRRLDRRRILGLLGMAGGTVFLSACGGENSSTGTTTTSADGTNTSRGSTSNVLTISSFQRQDIRSSLIGSSTVAQGVVADLTLTFVDVNNGCTPLSGYAIYLWHCDAEGEYSLYDLPAESYLRGIQVTDSNGQVTFRTIVPGCYSGRYPHIHFEAFSSLANATLGNYARLISQFAVPAAVCETVYAQSTYGSSLTRFRQTSIASDGIFGDNTSAQKTAMTLTMSGSVSDGYTGTATIGIAT